MCICVARGLSLRLNVLSFINGATGWIDIAARAKEEKLFTASTGNRGGAVAHQGIQTQKPLDVHLVGAEDRFGDGRIVGKRRAFLRDCHRRHGHQDEQKLGRVTRAQTRTRTRTQPLVHSIHETAYARKGSEQVG